ncbi:ABC transporter substrate-binding protein [Paenibacillus chartarius]|uniref:ABC transporter substrate-binding protein n=1 Tax=Paenibacillus chartarius TaxID=747481 RepID=A0ABV6DM02_9BACL
MITIRGMTWQHERGVAPLVAAASDYNRLHPDVKMEWDARSLQDFERYPLELLADRYDLIMIDHPHIGAAVAENLLLPLDDFIASSFLTDQRLQSVGSSYDSYTWEGRQWALAADAAAQIAAYRQDLLQQAGLELPRSWDDVLALAKELPEGTKIGLPLVPVHAYSSYFTLCAQIGGEAFWSRDLDVPYAVGEEALRILKNLLAVSHKQSAFVDPIGMYELLCTTNEIAYVPLIYGYSNYARAGFRPFQVRCANIPSANGSPNGSMIGGVGLAISSRCKHTDHAVNFLTMTVNGDYQKTSFFQNGGQPGHLKAWKDEEVNRVSNGFFLDTLETLTLGSMRPRFKGYIEFQERAGTDIRQFLIEGNESFGSIVHRLNQMIHRYKSTN